MEETKRDKITFEICLLKSFNGKNVLLRLHQCNDAPIIIIIRISQLVHHPLNSSTLY